MTYFSRIIPGSRFEWIRSKIRSKFCLYLNDDEIVEDMIKNMTEEDKKPWVGRTENDIYGVHHGTGRNIRNAYGLWMPDNPHTEINPPPNDKGIIDHPRFPDQVSHGIIVEVVRRLTEEANNEH